MRIIVSIGPGFAQSRKHRVSERMHHEILGQFQIITHVVVLMIPRGVETRRVGRIAAKQPVARVTEKLERATDPIAPSRERFAFSPGRGK